ncbi:MAG: biotin--[acetyl-CoA-carboxylase] ligase [Thermoleophilia bacterium]
MNVESRILSELSEDGYSSGEVISGKLNITRSAVWKHIVKLRDRGYSIDASPRHGYRLAGRPDKLLPAELAPLLETSILGRHIVHMEETPSTADVARELVGEGAAEGTVIFAESQTEGRGRLGRAWQTPAAKTIALSVILYPSLPPTRIPLLSLATALAVKRAVEGITSARVELKWPNDVYLEGRKLAGVLVEMAAEIDRVKWVIDSIGINVNNRIAGTDLEGRATSLVDELGKETSRRELAAAVLMQLEKIYMDAQSPAGLISIQRSFMKHDLLQGRLIEVKTPDGVVSGTADGIDSEGRLLVKDNAGRLQSLFSGEATIMGTQIK